MEYAVIYAKTKTGFSAHVPDLPGCIATGRTLEITRTRLREAIEMHLQGIREDGLAIPKATTQVESLRIGDAA